MTDPYPASGSGMSPREREAKADRDGDLLWRAQQRDQDAYRELVQRYYGMVYKLAYNFLSHAEDARDIAQDTFLRAFAAIDRFDLSMRFSPWLNKIAMNLITDAIRARYRSKSSSLESAAEIEDEAPDPADAPVAAEQSESVRKLVNALPIKYRTVLVLRDMEGCTVEEIAKMTKSPRATVRWRLHQARKLFKDKWERSQAS